MATCSMSVVAAASVAAGSLCSLRDMVTCCVLRAGCSATRHDHVDRTEVPKHRCVLQLALNSFFVHVNISQCEAVFRNHCLAERFGPQFCNVFLALDPSESQPLGSDFILHPKVCHINVLQSSISLSVNNVSGGLRIDVQHWLISYPRSFNSNAIPFDSDAPSSANSTASACTCMLSKCGCRAASRLCLTIFEFLHTLPSLNQKMLSLLQLPFHS